MNLTEQDMDIQLATIKCHLFYIDDLKLYVKDDIKLKGHTLRAFSDDIEMEFSLNRCAKDTYQK